MVREIDLFYLIKRRCFLCHVVLCSFVLCGVLIREWRLYLRHFLEKEVKAPRYHALEKLHGKENLFCRVPMLSLKRSDYWHTVTASCYVQLS